MLILFVAIFSVVLAIGAFALDQGLWLGKRRVVQGQADAAARAGAFAYLTDINDTYGSCVAAAEHAQRDGVAVSNPGSCLGDNPDTIFDSNDDCISNNDGIRSAKAQINLPVRSLLSQFFGIAGIDVGADATACLGTIQRLGPSDITSYLPIYIRSDDGATDCLNGGIVGRECVIVRACNRRGGFFFSDDCTFGGGSLRSGFFRVPDQSPLEDCEEDFGGTSTQINRILDAIEDADMGFVCRINPNTSGSTCPSPSDETCIDPQSNFPDDDDDHRDILRSFENRLDRLTSSCDSFTEIFRRADGQPSIGRPWRPGGDPRDTVYMQRCESSRVGLIVFTDSTARRVKGFATVYITGCFDDDASFSGNENRCDGSLDDDDEVRGAIIRTYMPEADQGELGKVPIVTGGPTSGRNINLPVTIQTVE